MKNFLLIVALLSASIAHAGISGGGGGLLPANNLSDVASASASRTSLGLGTIATANAGSYCAVTGCTLTGAITETIEGICTELSSDPVAPSAGLLKRYCKTDHNVYIENSSGVVTQVTGTALTAGPNIYISGGTVSGSKINGTAHTTSYAMLAGDADTQHINCASACNFTMPPPGSTSAGRIITLINDANSGTSNALVTILPNAGETFGATGLSSLTMQTVGEVWKFGANTNWDIVFHKATTDEVTYTMTVASASGTTTFGTHTFTTYWMRNGSLACVRAELNQTSAGGTGTGIMLYSTPFTAASTMLLNNAPTATNVTNTIGGGSSYNSGDALKMAGVGLRDANNFYISLSSSHVMDSSGGTDHLWSATTESLSFRACYTVANWYN